MNYHLWIIAGIIMLAITYFVHKNTYSYKGKKLPLPLWSVILAVLVAFIPLVNISVFIIGTGAYTAAMGNCDIKFSCKAKWWTSVVKVMTRNLNKDE